MMRCLAIALAIVLATQLLALQVTSGTEPKPICRCQVEKSYRRVDQRETDCATPLSNRTNSTAFRITIRVATFNVSFNRPKAGDLANDFVSQDNAQANKIAEIIQRVRPDILLLNEVDYDEDGLAIRRFQDKFLSVAHGTAKPIAYAHSFSASVNTGVQSGLDLDNDGQIGGPGDAFGYGYFLGQYGMCLLSRYPINVKQIRTFQNFLWQDMPGALLPNTDGTPYYTDAELAKLRLSSKSHWDVPIVIEGKVVHLLCSHPTPPVFDGPEDRNGQRNHDEIRFWADDIDETRSSYIYDDRGAKGGLPAESQFILVGDMNADPMDGDSSNNAIDQLLSHPMINSSLVPASLGARLKATRDAGVNRMHRGDSSQDTSDFNDRTVGNLRLDYVLPSNRLKVISCGVYWPAENEEGYNLLDASDHRLVWIEIEL